MAAIGGNKAGFILEVVRLGLANHLLVDDDLAEALDKLLVESLPDGL